MQYVEQTNRILKTRFNEHYHRIRKPKKTDTFLYRHFKRTGHSLNDVSIQSMEKIYYDVNSTARFKIIKRHETELKWIKSLQTPFPLGINDNIYHESNISIMSNFDISRYWNVKTVKRDLTVLGKTANINVNCARLKKTILG